MRCQKCGAYIRDDSIYCNYCGEKVIVHVPRREAGEPQGAVRPRDEDFDAAPTAPREESARTVPPKQKPWVIALILLVGVVFAVVACIFYQYMRKNQRTVINALPSSTETQAAVVQPSGETQAAETDNAVPETPAAVTEPPAETNPENETAPPETTAEPSEAAPSEEDSTEEETSEETSPAEPYDIEVDGLVYRIEGGRATLIQCNNIESEIVLPENVNGVPLKAIAEAAFANCETMEAIDMPEGLEELGVYCFTYCTHLRIVVIPDSVKRIGDHAFDHTPRMIFVVHEGTLGHETAVRYNVTYVIGDSIDAATDVTNY